MGSGMGSVHGRQFQDIGRVPVRRGVEGGVATVSMAEPATLTLDGRGMICDCNVAAEKLFHYSRGEIVWRYVSMLLPQLAETHLTRDGETDPRLRFLCRIGRRFQARTREGQEIPSELFINVLDNTGRQRRIVLIVRPVEEHDAESDPAAGAPS